MKSKSTIVNENTHLTSIKKARRKWLVHFPRMRTWCELIAMFQHQKYWERTSHEKSLRNQNASEGLRAMFLKWALKMCPMTRLHFINSSLECSGQNSPEKFIKKDLLNNKIYVPHWLRGQGTHHDWHSC